MSEPSDPQSSRPVPGGAPRFGAAGRAAKLLPPSDVHGTLPRVELERRLLNGTDRRLTVIVAGAGFGKSTLAAHLARSTPSAWYTLDASDRQLGTLASGVAAAIRAQAPTLPLELTLPVEGSIEAHDEAEALERAQAAAALIADALPEHLHDDLALVLDDLHVIDAATASWRFVEALVRVAPPELHLVITSRHELPFGVERLRGQGQVLDLGGPTLSFTAAEIDRVVAAVLEGDPATPGERADVSARIFEATGGWPAAVRLALEAYRGAAPDRRAATLERLQHPDGPLFAYLAEEVVSRASDETRDLVARAVHFDRFSAPLCVAIGSPNAERILASLSRRALFLQTHPRARAGTPSTA
jgi:ATP/maltotriose-dependent transcriptional regulator MalT